MTLSAAAIILAIFMAGLALIIIGWRARRTAAEAHAPEAVPAAPEMPADPIDQVEAISQRVATLLQDHERRLTDAFSHVREDLSGLKSDVEWLAGERMIDQAIALAQTGSGVEEIGQELGLSRDQAATIALFRKH